jgi:probable O-glycosylation ligase (exosortase A-associated)
VRDLAILILLVIGCVWTLRQPWVGAVLWTVVSLGSPHMQFGYAAAGWPVAMAVAGCTVLGMLVTKERRNPFGNAAVVLTFVLAAWMSLALPLSLEPDLSYDMWERSMKISVMLFVTLALIDTREKLNAFVWANVVAIGYYGVKGGLFSIMTGGSFIILGPGGFIGGNNELALAEIVVLPFMRYLQQQSESKWMRRALGASMGLMAISIVVSHSRGALLGLIAMLLFFWLKNDNKFRWGVMIVLGSTVILGAMPDEWWNRMDTIKDYNEDTSAQGRINSWWLAWNVATDRITGGGFRLTVPWIFAKYAPNPKMIFVAHSIYFQMMGEQGFIGLIIFLLIGATTWLNAARMIRVGHADPALKWAAELGAMVHASMVGFAVSGAFLSLAYFDLPYNVMGMTAVAVHLIARHVTARGAAISPVAAPKPPAPRIKPPLPGRGLPTGTSRK